MRLHLHLRRKVSGVFDVQDLSSDGTCIHDTLDMASPSVLVAVAAADASNRRRHQSSSSVGQCLSCVLLQSALTIIVLIHNDCHVMCSVVVSFMLVYC